MNEFGFDPQRALDAFKRLAADAPAQLADGFTRLVRDVPPERLEQLMHSPARKPILDGIFWQMPKQVNVSDATDLKTSIRWSIIGRGDGGTDTYQLELDNGRCWVDRGAHLQTPRLTVTIDGVDFLRLVSGNLDPMKAYFKGQIKLAGDIMVAAKLAALFRIPGAPSANGEKSPDDGLGGSGAG
ncbi:MAG: SCP2 sterol-binding domain-containing protein [Solirubrobacteraceae bacterium]